MLVEIPYSSFIRSLLYTVDLSLWTCINAYQYMYIYNG